jgi:two-component sensor histidine kinase
LAVAGLPGTTALAGETALQPRPTLLLLDAATPSPDLATHFEYLEDCTGSLTLRDVTSGTAAKDFRQARSRRLNFGYSQCAYWVRLEVMGQGEIGGEWLLTVKNSRAEHVDFHRDGAIVRSGSTVPMSRRQVPSRYPVFELGQMPAQATTLFLRLQTTDVASYPLELLQAEAFAEALPRVSMLLGMFYGIMLFMALFSAIVYIYLRDTAYLLFSLLLISYMMFEAAVNGLDIAYLWPEHPWWNMTAIPFWCGLILASAAAFASRFLILQQYAPALHRLLNKILVACLLITVIGMTGAFTTAGILGSVLALVLVISLAIAGIVAMARGCPHAKYFLLAGTLEFFGVLFNSLHNFAAVPTMFISTFGTQIGSTLFVLITSSALMARVNLLRRENESAQKQMLESARAAADAKRCATELRMQALQAKINPHFLFNTLNTITGLISEAPARAQGVVTRLSRLFRYTLAVTEKDRVLLAEELEIVRSYLEIEQERFGERLYVDIQVQGDIRGLTLPGLTIQPLVENSVRHGIRPKVEGGKITVTVRVEGETVLITVEDDGVGMDVTRSTDGHGVHSVRERLRLAYGEASTMTLLSTAGLRIDISLPAERSLKAGPFIESSRPFRPAC